MHDNATPWLSVLVLPPRKEKVFSHVVVPTVPTDTGGSLSTAAGLVWYLTKEAPPWIRPVRQKFSSRFQELDLQEVCLVIAIKMQKTTSRGLGESTKKQFCSVFESPQKSYQARSLRVHKMLCQ